MSSNAMTFLELIINSMWRLFTGWKFPGLGFTPAQFFAFLLIFPLIIQFVYALFSGYVLSDNSSRSSSRSRRGDK